MPSTYTDNDLVSPELAERLAKLGMKWEPKLFDLFWNGEAGNLLSWSFSESDWRLFNTGWATWLPRRIDCEAKLVEMGYDYQRLTLHRPLRSGYEFYADSIEQDKWVRGSAPTPAKAVGLALEQAMAQHES